MAETSVPNLTEAHWWHGALELEDLGDGRVRAWRTPYRDPRFDIGISYAGTPAGVRITMRTSASHLSLTVRPDMDDPSPVDIVVDGELRHRLPIAGPVAAELPGVPATVEIWLPQYGCAEVTRLELTGDPAPQPIPPRPVRWVTHGSSITMNKQADGPWTAWPSRVARALDLELYNLAYAGTAVFDPPVARLIRDTPAELISLCLGINVHHALTHNRRSLVPAAIGFVETIREGQPDTPIVVISPISALPQRDAPNVLGLSISDIRDCVHEAMDRILQATGDQKLHVIDGRDLLGPDDLDLLVDDVHPGDAGCAQIAERIAPTLARLV